MVDDSWARGIRAWVPAQPLSSCVTLAGSSSLSLPQFPYLSMRMQLLPASQAEPPGAPEPLLLKGWFLNQGSLPPSPSLPFLHPRFVRPSGLSSWDRREPTVNLGRIDSSSIMNVPICEGDFPCLWSRRPVCLFLNLVLSILEFWCY